MTVPPEPLYNSCMMRTQVERVCAGCGVIETVRPDSLHRMCRKCSAKASHSRPEFREKQRIAKIGKTTWMKGRTHTPDANEKNRLAHVGKRYSTATEFKSGLIPHNKKIVGEALIRSLYLSGLSAVVIGEEVGLSKPTILKRLAKMDVIRRDSAEILRQRNLQRTPEEHPRWKGGATPANVKIRMSTEYQTWRHTVFHRDDHACQHCHTRGGRLHADHIKPFALFPELRFELTNGRTLCVPCHKKTPTYLRSNLKREDFV